MHISIDYRKMIPMERGEAYKMLLSEQKVVMITPLFINVIDQPSQMQEVAKYFYPLNREQFEYQTKLINRIQTKITLFTVGAILGTSIGLGLLMIEPVESRKFLALIVTAISLPLGLLSWWMLIKNLFSKEVSKYRNSIINNRGKDGV